MRLPREAAGFRGWASLSRRFQIPLAKNTPERAVAAGVDLPMSLGMAAGKPGKYSRLKDLGANPAPAQ